MLVVDVLAQLHILALAVPSGTGDPLASLGRFQGQAEVQAVGGSVGLLEDLLRAPAFIAVRVYDLVAFPYGHIQVFYLNDRVGDDLSSHVHRRLCHHDLGANVSLHLLMPPSFS